MKPSMRTSGAPLIVAIRITRRSGMGEPPLIKKRVWSGELLLRVKESSNTLGVAGPEFEVTLTLVSASRITCGTGTATTGPIINVRWIPLSTSHWSWDSLRQSNFDGAARHFEFFRHHDAIRVAKAPELFRIAKKTCCDVVEAIALHNDILPQHCEICRIGQHAAAKIGDGLAARNSQRVCANTVVPACRRQCASGGRTEINRLLNGIVAVAHGICSIPSPLSEPMGLFDRKVSFCCRYAIQNPVPLWSEGRSSMLSTRRPRLTLARIGFNAGSKASSVTLKSVMRTGRTRLR